MSLAEKIPADAAGYATAAQLAVWLGVSRVTIGKWVVRGKLPTASKVEGQRRLWLVEAVRHRLRHWAEEERAAAAALAAGVEEAFQASAVPAPGAEGVVPRVPDEPGQAVLPVGESFRKP